MKKWFCCFLAILIVVFTLPSCTSQNDPQIDKSLCYLEDAQMELLTPKDTVVEKKGLVYSEEHHDYSYPEGEYATINDTPFLASFEFNSSDVLADAFYIPMSENFSFAEMKEYLDSIYGQSEEYANEYEEEGYSWTTETEKGTYQILLLKYSSELFRIDVQGITGDVRLDDSNSELAEKWENVGEAASEFYEGIQNSSGVTFYEIEPESGLISQEQFDDLKEGMTYQDAMETLGASENPDIPSNASSFSCEWENSSSFVMLLFVDGKLVSYSSYGLV